MLCSLSHSWKGCVWALPSHSTYSVFIQMSLLLNLSCFFILFASSHCSFFEIIYSNLFGVYLLSATIYLNFWICAGSLWAFSVRSLVCLLQLWVRERKKTTTIDNQKDIKCALCPADQQHNQPVSAVRFLRETKQSQGFEWADTSQD